MGNDVLNAKKAVVFLSAIGARAYELLRNLLVLDLPKFTDLVVIVTLCLHFSVKPKPLVIEECYKFYKQTVIAEWYSKPADPQVRERELIALGYLKAIMNFNMPNLYTHHCDLIMYSLY